MGRRRQLELILFFLLLAIAIQFGVRFCSYIVTSNADNLSRTADKTLRVLYNERLDAGYRYGQIFKGIYYNLILVTLIIAGILLFAKKITFGEYLFAVVLYFLIQIIIFHIGSLLFEPDKKLAYTMDITYMAVSAPETKKIYMYTLAAWGIRTLFSFIKSKFTYFRKNG